MMIAKSNITPDCLLCHTDGSVLFYRCFSIGQQQDFAFCISAIYYGADDIAFKSWCSGHYIQIAVSQSTVLWYCNKWIIVMYVCLEPLVKWPGRDELRKALPMEFRDDFQKYTVIIDFESFMNDPQT